MEIIKTEFFGDWYRYKLTEAIDRFGNKVFFVTDAEVICPLTGLPEVIRQESTREEALQGLI